MKKVKIDSLDMDNTFFHFDAREINFIEQHGFPAEIGPDSKNAEKTPKVFFSKGVKGVLDIIDVWLIWRMNKDHQNSEDWTKEFFSGDYLYDEIKKEITFDNMYKWLEQRKYYKVELIEGIDYLENDIDEAKQSAIKDKVEKENTKGIPWKFLFAYEMYKGKIAYSDETMEDWNMHTITGHGISSDKIFLIETCDGKDDALSVVETLYSRYEPKNEFRLLNSFMNYCKKRRSIKDNVKER